MAKKNLFDFNFSTDLPDQNKIPINESSQDRTVKEILIKDIKNSQEYLIITGFTSLSQLIDVFGANDYPDLIKLRVSIGFDPDERISKRLAHYSLTTEIKNFWIKQNVSIRLCGPIINLIDKIEKGKYEFRVKDKLHAKLYVGKEAAILGSSNFSKSGTIKQAEANIRVTTLLDTREKEQYDEIKKLAEYYYSLSEDYNDTLINLLRTLLKEATWEEALARALNEILESPWMKDYPVLYNALQNHQLWPSQKIGLAKAMKIIQDQGRVLIADPTGSGKTKLAVTLAYTLFHWLWENGLKDRSTALTICPKQVIDNWEKEQTPFKVQSKVVSMGKLSQGNEKTIKLLQKEIEGKDILIVDEAHNFLSPYSIRSRSINPKAATHIILSTATPINKKPDDLLRLIELLDIDNLSDDDLKEYRALKRNRGKQFNKTQLDNLKTYINQFIVRRTKKELNRMIKREPEQYKNRNDHPCRYPTTLPETYDTGETTDDKKIALSIRDLALELKGINYLQKWKIPSYYNSEIERKRYIDQRFTSATALAAFMVRSCLRSSNCALIEYLHGTERANQKYQLNALKQPTGNIIDSVEKCKKAFSNLKFPTEFVTKGIEWITNQNLYEEVCIKEIEIYSRISELALTLSGARETTKATTLLKVMNEYGKILAFDSKIITLDYIKSLVLKENPEAIVLVASGTNERNKNLVKEYFSLQTKNKDPLIALCSDAMAEGINLPDAKALVLLDMPSVLRLIEQRIGRLERMDSEHDEIHILWPADSEEFSLKGDKRIVDILLMAENLIGINVDIPREVYDRHLKGVNSTKDIIERYKEYEESDDEWEGVKDNTQSLFNLMEGPDALITPEDYKIFLGVDASVKTAISFIETEKTFNFFAFRGDAARSPKWLFIDERNNSYTDFSDIADKLKEYLKGQTIIRRKWSEVNADTEIKKILKKLRSKEKFLLPHKKKRALEVGKRILNELLNSVNIKDKRRYVIEKLLSLYEVDVETDEWIDYNHFAELWLSILLPALDKRRNERVQKRRIITLSDLKLKDIQLDEKELNRIFENCQYAATLDQLIAACIIGLPSDQKSIT
jgi:superfamily II DNA or RNA helicase